LEKKTPSTTVSTAYATTTPPTPPAADPFQFVAKYRENHPYPLDGNKVRAGDGKGELAKVAKKCSFDFFLF
jgi:hypothetical protein